LQRILGFKRVIKWIIRYITKERTEKEGLTNPYDVLKHEVKIYDAYISGQTYGAMILDSEGDVIDSQFGYVGDTTDYVINEAKSMIDTYN